MQIKVSTNFPQEPIIRQTPGRSGLWKDAQFSINEKGGECDYWVVMDGLTQPDQAFCNSGRAILFTLEPPGLRIYRPGFLDQFDLVVTCHSDFKHANMRHAFQGLGWHVGIHRPGSGALGDGGYTATLDYDDLCAMPVPEKPRLISVICSNKTFLEGHRLRLAFVEELKQAFGDSIELFGRGIRPITDKLEAIAPFKYHIVLENSITPDYWTEKLTDAYLGFAHPFYSGCPNIDDYFGPGSLTKIDITKPAEAIATIQRAIADNVYTRDFKQRSIARRMILDDYNTFEVIRRTCESLPPTQPRTIKLKRNESFELWSPKRLLAGLRFRFNRFLGAKNGLL